MKIKIFSTTEDKQKVIDSATEEFARLLIQIRNSATKKDKKDIKN